MSTDPATSLRPAARAAGHARASTPETPRFVATLAADPISPSAPRAATGAIAASLRAPLVPSSGDLPDRPRTGARAASSVSRG